MLKAITFDMDDTLIDWRQRSEDWYEYERQHLERVFSYVAREVHLVRAPEAFYEAVQSLARETWLEASRELRAPHLPILDAWYPGWCAPNGSGTASAGAVE